jgi:hypothetical protein
MHLLRNEPLDVYVAGDLNTKSPNDTNVSLRPFEKIEKILPSQLPLTQEAQHSFDEWSKITLMSPVSHNTCCVSKLGEEVSAMSQSNATCHIRRSPITCCVTRGADDNGQEKQIFEASDHLPVCGCRVSYIQYIDAGK